RRWRNISDRTPRRLAVVRGPSNAQMRSTASVRTVFNTQTPRHKGARIDSGGVARLSERSTDDTNEIQPEATGAAACDGPEGRRGSALPRSAPADRRVLASVELPVGWSDLSARQSPAAAAAHAREHQAAPARPLGHDAWPQLHLRPSQPRHRDP